MNYWEARKVVVTGGNGFLGRHVIDRLTAAGALALSCSRASGCDLRDLRQACAFLEHSHAELVINCAANQGGLEYQRLYPATIFYDNLLMSANAMEAARLAGVRKYVNIIAGCTYPGDDRPLQIEEDLEAGPLHPSVENYAGAKRAALIQGRCYRRQYGMLVTPLVVVNMFGPGEHFHPDRSHAIAALIRKFYEAKRDGTSEVVLWGTGSPVRDWLFVEDAAEAIVLAAELYDGPEPLNLGTGTGYKMTEIADVIRDVVGCRATIVWDSSKPDGAPRKVVETTKARRLLNWQARTPLREAIARTFDWFTGNYEAATAEPGMLKGKADGMVAPQ